MDSGQDFRFESHRAHHARLHARPTAPCTAMGSSMSYHLSRLTTRRSCPTLLFWGRDFRFESHRAHHARLVAEGWIGHRMEPVASSGMERSTPVLKGFRRVWIAVTVLSVVAVGCTGSSTTDETTTTMADTVTTTSGPVTTTSTVAPGPVAEPAGVWWGEGIEVGVPPGPENRVRGLDAFDDDLFVYGDLYNGSFLSRSTDGGLTWTRVDPEPPPTSGRYRIDGIVAKPDGGYLLWGELGGRCSSNIDAGDGYRFVGICTRWTPVIHLSDDGTTWRRVDPPTLAPNGDSSVRVHNVVATPDGGLLLSATVEGSDWHGRLFRSDNGEAWDLVREFRGEEHPMSLTSILADEGTVVAVAMEHPCAEPSDGTGGWALGTDWAADARIYVGTNTDNLALAGPGDHPFAGNLEYDCEATSSFTVAQIPNPLIRGEMLSSVITLYEIFEQPNVDELDPDTGGQRRWAQLIDGTWQVTTVTGVPVFIDAPNSGSMEDVFPIDGEPGILEFEGGGPALRLPRLIVGGDGTDSSVIVAARGVPAKYVDAGAWVDGVFVIAGTAAVDPFFSNIGGGSSETVPLVWRSVAGTDPFAGRCVLEPGADCRFADLTTMPGYPDFTGMDLHGIDLSFAELGEADLSDADLTGARLWGVTSDADAMMRGATLDDVEAGDAQLGDAQGASFIGADLRSARIRDATGADFTRARLQLTSLDFSTLPVLDGALTEGVRLSMRYDPTGAIPFEIDLSGLQLTRANIQPDRDAQADNLLLVITDVSDAVLDQTTFKAVDLTAIDIEDLTDARVWENSICPDGNPPDDPPIGTCVRGG
ncbi:MAG: hypothetical protein DWP92_04610 [Armatimonadetes bacterium]|nr:MAG: hypothetical protein DWP92_04610 [Armatimonadota bacterium]